MRAAGCATFYLCVTRVCLCYFSRSDLLTRFYSVGFADVILHPPRQKLTGVTTDAFDFTPVPQYHLNTGPAHYVNTDFDQHIFAMITAGVVFSAAHLPREGARYWSRVQGERVVSTPVRGEPSTPDPQPPILIPTFQNPHPYISKPSTLNPQLSTINPKP